MKIIHAADLHIDSPLRGLSNYPGAPADSIRGASRKALMNLVRLAKEEAVDAVVLAGDIFDGDWPDFNTGLFFRSQMSELTKAGIAVFIAKGNHDAESQVTRELPQVNGVHVFSTAQAETVTLLNGALAVHGRSYAERDTMTNLVPDYPPPLPGAFNIGVLHTCLDGSADHSPYAPTSTAELVAKGYDYWALGHIHLRQVVREASPRMVFPGNLQGRHAKETGSKGCELIEVHNGSIVRTRHVCLDVVRWHQVEIDAKDATDLDDLAQSARTRLQSLLAGCNQDDLHKLHAVRTNVTGSSELRRIESTQPSSIEQTVRAAAGDVDAEHLWVEKVRLEVVEKMDRAQAAERPDAIAELITMVDELTHNPDQLSRLIDNELGDLKVMPSGLTDASPSNLTQEERLAILRDAESSILHLVANQAHGATA